MWQTERQRAFCLSHLHFKRKALFSGEVRLREEGEEMTDHKVAAGLACFTFTIPEAKGKVTKKADNDRLAIALALEKLTKG